MADPPKSSSNSSLSPSLFENALRATRFRLRLADISAAVLLMLALGLAGVLAIVVADHSVPGGLSLWTRWTLRWILFGAEAVLLTVLIALPLLRRISNLYAARQMEQADASFHNDLTAAVQLQEKTEPAVAAVRRNASRQVSRVSNGAPVQKRNLKLASLAVGAAVLAFCFYWLLAPKSTTTSLRRVMGIGNPPSPTRTRILIFTPPDETTVLTGNEVPFEARLRYPHGPAVLKISRDAHTVLDEDVLTMTPVDEPGPGEAYHAAWKAVSAGAWAKFRLACGDAETPWRRIRVLPTPAVRCVRVKCDWPKYTALPPQTSEGGRVEGTIGTRATVTAEVNLPVKRASLVFESDGRTLVMTPDATGRFISTNFRINKPGKYVIYYELRDIEAEARSIPHEVVVTPDRPPTVRLDQPADATTLTENESLDVLGEVADDFGVGRVELVCKTKNGQTRTYPLLQQKSPGASSRRVRSSIEAASLGRPGDTLTCVVQARDMNPSAPDGGQVTQSKPFTLTITPARTTTEQQETDEGQDQAELAQAQTKSEETQSRIRETLSPSEEQQPNSQESPSKSEDAETKPDPEEVEKLKQLCKAMDDKDAEGQQGKEQGAKGQEGETSEGQGESPGGDIPNVGQGETGKSDAGDKGQQNTEGNPPAQSQCEESPSRNQGKQNNSDSRESSGGSDQAGGNQGEKPSPTDESGQNPSSEKKNASQNPPSPGNGTKNEQQPPAGEQASQNREQGQQQPSPPRGDASQNPMGAQSVHDGKDSGAGSDFHEGELEAVDDETLMPGTTQPLESVGRALDKARRQIENDAVDPKLLEAMGMTPGEFKAFVEKYTEVYNKHLQKRESQKHTVRAVQPVGRDDVQHGLETKTGNVTADSPLDKQRSEKDRRMSPAKVSPEYQKQLEAYLRAVSESEEK